MESYLLIIDEEEYHRVIREATITDIRPFTDESGRQLYEIGSTHFHLSSNIPFRASTVATKLLGTGSLQVMANLAGMTKPPKEWYIKIKQQVEEALRRLEEQEEQ